MNKNVKVILIIGVLAVAGYFVYQWWQNRSSTGSGSLGANLNSAAPELVGGSAGPDSGLNYYAGSTPITIDLPNGNQSQNDTGNQGDGDNEPGGGPPPGGYHCRPGQHWDGKHCVPDKKGSKIPIGSVTHRGKGRGKGGKHATHEGNFTINGGNFP